MQPPLDALAAEQNSLGLTAAGRGELAAAEMHFRAAVSRAPGFAQAHNNLGVALEMQNRLEEAEHAYRAGLAARPDYAEGWQNLGVVLERLGRFEHAESACRRALVLNPASLTAANGLGVALLRLGRLDESAAILSQVVRQCPDFAAAHSNLGAVLEDLRRLDEAVVAFEHAITLEPGNVGALVNAGLLYERLGKTLTAKQSFERAISQEPHSAEAQLNLGLLNLRDGDCANGWPGYRWRNELNGQSAPQPPLPRWDGSSLVGRTILLCEDQGAGDSIQFMRFSERLAQQDARVVVQSSDALADLLKSCRGVAAVCRPSEPCPAADVFLPIADVPGMLGVDLTDLPIRTPYLFPPADLTDAWQRELATVHELRVGIAWQGNPQNKNDRDRSFPLRLLRELMHTPDTRFYSLQFGTGREQIAESDCHIVDLGDRLGRFHETAALVQCLDLVITCDSSPAHLAGALAVPVWVALAHFADWRWLRGRSDSPWYPSMRLFRQPRAGAWQDVFHDIAKALRELLSQRRSAGCGGTIASE